tara:strand:- start:4007 stop:5023 length:1017 start_codon:yes stop_codon:yes gene_type:complete
MKKKIICTIGPSSSSKKVLSGLKKNGVDIFRINLSHTSSKQLSGKINLLKKNKIKNICIDTEGAQIRTTKVKKKIYFKKNKKVKIYIKNSFSNKNNIYLYPNFNLMTVKVDSKIFIGFDNLEIKILKKNLKEKFLVGKVTNHGLLESNKSVHFSCNIKLPPLTEKDIAAVKYSIKKGVKIFAMSFVNSHKDVDKIRELIGKKSFLISKIETDNAIRNLKSISKKSNALLIDRGDLSRYVRIEKIPLAQRYICSIAKENKTPVYVATNLLESMVKNIQPTRAESNDIFTTLENGADGLVLAAESAIGSYPILAAKFLKDCIKVFAHKKKISDKNLYLLN